jgi:hypothetical protein
MFTRSVELPRGIDVSRIDAEVCDGVLKLHIPKSAEAMQRRQIPIRARESRREQSREQPRVMGPGSAGGGEQRAQQQRYQANAR